MSKKKSKTEKIECMKCKRILAPSSANYYLNGSPFFNEDVERFPVCKRCINEFIGEKGSSGYLDRVKLTLAHLNKPFILSYWEDCNENWSDYIPGIMSLPQHRGLTFANSNTTKRKDKKNYELVTEKSDVSNTTTMQTSNNTGYDTNDLKEKYGYGYPDEEYILFEQKYQQLRPSFQLVTTMHEEYFKEFCINKVKETLAKAKGDFKEAKEWANMVKDVAEAGKLKPSQMSKADLSGGMDTFGQLARLVEENYEIMPLLPQFTETPKDKVDVVLWAYINYVRDLKGLPEADYKDIYHFYELRRQDYEGQMSDELLSTSTEDGFDDVLNQIEDSGDENVEL